MNVGPARVENDGQTDPHGSDLTAVTLGPLDGATSLRLSDERWLRLLAVAVILALGAVGLHFALHGQLNADEGFYLLASRLVADGFQPYRDFGYTQGPVLPYANIPWLELFGYDLLGQRLAGLSWAVLAAAVGAAVLRRRLGWRVTVGFAILLAASPGWLSFATKGKTYAFAAVAVLMGVIAVTSRASIWWRWTVFLIAASLGVGARLPLVAFFAVAGFVMLVQTSGWHRRSIAFLVTLALAAAVITWGAAGAWEQASFWTFGFHRATPMRFSWGVRLDGFFFLAPAAWMLLVWHIAVSWRGRDRAWFSGAICVTAGIAANLLPYPAYGEYTAPFALAAAFVVAPSIASLVDRLPRIALTSLVVFGVVIGWIRPPAIERGVTDYAAEATAFLRLHVSPNASVAATMPEIPVAAGCTVPLGMAPGKFSVSEDYDQQVADSLHLLTPDDVVAMLSDPNIAALILSPAPKWNFSWSVPSYRWLSYSSTERIGQAVGKHFVVGYADPHYVIFLRKPPPLLPAEQELSSVDHTTDSM